MGSVDFAFLAEFAKAEQHGTLTTVGAGLFGVLPSAPEMPIPVFVAGRVRQQPKASETLGITIESPGREYSLEQSMDITAPSSGPGEQVDMTTTVFAVQIQIPIAGEGRYLVRVALGESEPFDIDLWVKLPERTPAVTGEGAEEDPDPLTGE